MTVATLVVHSCRTFVVWFLCQKVVHVAEYQFAAVVLWTYILYNHMVVPSVLLADTLCCCLWFITFRVRRTPREMHCSHARLCVCLCDCFVLSVHGRMPTLLHGPGYNLAEW